MYRTSGVVVTTDGVIRWGKEVKDMNRYTVSVITTRGGSWGGGGGLMGQGQGYEQNHQEVKGMNRITVAVITDGTRRSKL